MMRIHVPLASLLLFGSLHAAQVCDLTLTACPKQLPTGTIQVPLDVISLDARIPYCRETGVIASQVQPSIVFIIDNSGSMSMGNYADNLENDPQEARFSVVSSLLDVINASHPGTEVGMVFFSRRLQFDHRDNPLFKTAFPNDTSQHDSYMPLTKLNKIFPDGRTGLDTLRALLKHDTDGNMAYATKRPASRGNGDPDIAAEGGRLNMRRGTDISLGFEAAKLAILETTAPRENRFFIFLSDGAPGALDSGRAATENAFQQGVSTPTTFTVYFQRGNNPQVPNSVQTMTNNIRNNGYSTSNPKSTYNAISLPEAELQELLQTTLLTNILTVPTTGKGVEVVANGQTQSTTTRADSSNFLVSARMPLNAALTTIQFNYTHSFRDTTKVPAVTRDTVIGYSLNVQRAANATLPANMTKTCREQAALTLHSGGQSLTTVTADHANLEVRLTPTAGQTCANCTVQVSPSGSADRESLNLAAQGAYLSGSFIREESITPAAADGKLQHIGSDSLVLVWTNPQNALDVVRRSFPYQSILPTLSLFHDNAEINAVTAQHGTLEVRLTLPSGQPCNGCQVQVLPSGTADRENVTLAGTASPFRGTFIRAGGVNHVLGDGKLTHLATDSIILIYVNPLTQQQVRRGYAFQDIAPTLSLFHDGKELDTVTAEHVALEIRLTLPAGETCNGCQVQVLPSASADREAMVMTGAASPYRKTFNREVSATPVSGDGKLTHLANDSLILVYVNPLTQQPIRRAYLYVDFKNEIILTPHNDVAKTSPNPGNDQGPQWVISDAPTLVIQTKGEGGSCCQVLPGKLTHQSEDSSRFIGLVVEATREFTVDMAIFTNLGQLVNKVSLAVPRSEFIKLSPVTGKDTRAMRLLWNGVAMTGARAGTGAYIFRSTVTLLPVPGVTESTKSTTTYRTMGIMRQ